MSVHDAMSRPPVRPRLAAPDILARKGGERIVALTAYDALAATILLQHALRTFATAAEVSADTATGRPPDATDG